MRGTSRLPYPAKNFKVAAVVFDPAWGDLDGNIARTVNGIEDVAKRGVCLAALPETATTGYIGKYRKHGLNSRDRRRTSAGPRSAMPASRYSIPSSAG